MVSMSSANPQAPAATARATNVSGQTRHPELAAQSGLPIKGLRDLTTSGDYWFTCVPADGTPAEMLRDQPLKVYGVTIYVSIGLPGHCPP
jgi:hypothetical protein